MKHLVIASLILSSSNFAFGMVKTSGNLSPDMGQFEFQAAAAYTSVTMEQSQNSGKADLTGYGTPFSIFYGVNANDSFGLTVGYTSIENKLSQPGYTDTTTKKKGINDAKVAYKGNYDFMSTTFYSTAGVGIPLEKSKMNSTTGESTTTQGRITPFIEAGLVLPVNEYAFGFTAGLEMPLEGNRDYTAGTTTINVTTKDGNTTSLKVWAELENQYHPLLGLSYNRFDTENGTYNGVTVSTNTPYSTIGVQASLRFNLTQTVEIWPAIEYTTLTNKDDLTASSYNQLSAGASLRALF